MKGATKINLLWNKFCVFTLQELLKREI